MSAPKSSPYLGKNQITLIREMFNLPVVGISEQEGKVKRSGAYLTGATSRIAEHSLARLMDLNIITMMLTADGARSFNLTDKGRKIADILFFYEIEPKDKPWRCKLSYQEFKYLKNLYKHKKVELKPDCFWHNHLLSETGKHFVWKFGSKAIIEMKIRE